MLISSSTVAIRPLPRWVRVGVRVNKKESHHFPPPLDPLPPGEGKVDMPLACPILAYTFPDLSHINTKLMNFKPINTPAAGSIPI